MSIFLAILGVVLCFIGVVGIASGDASEVAVFLAMGMVSFFMSYVVYASQKGRSNERSTPPPNIPQNKPSDIAKPKKERKSNKTSKILIAIGASTLIYAIATAAQNAEEDMGAVTIVFLIAGIVLLLVGWAKKDTVDTSSETTSNNSSQAEYIQNLKEQLAIARSQMISELNKIDKAYMLNLSKADYVAITSSTNIPAALRNRIKPGTPTVSEYYSNMEKTIESLYYEMPMTDEQVQDVATAFVYELMPEITDEKLREIAFEFGKYVHKDFPFLKDKINYELGALGVIMTVAQRNNDLNLYQKVQAIRKKRGYID